MLFLYLKIINITIRGLVQWVIGASRIYFLKAGIKLYIFILNRSETKCYSWPFDHTRRKNYNSTNKYVSKQSHFQFNFIYILHGIPITFSIHHEPLHPFKLNLHFAKSDEVNLLTNSLINKTRLSRTLVSPTAIISLMFTIVFDTEIHLILSRHIKVYDLQRNL